MHLSRSSKKSFLKAFLLGNIILFLFYALILSILYVFVLQGFIGESIFAYVILVLCIFWFMFDFGIVLIYSLLGGFDDEKWWKVLVS